MTRNTAFPHAHQSRCDLFELLKPSTPIATRAMTAMMMEAQSTPNSFTGGSKPSPAQAAAAQAATANAVHAQLVVLMLSLYRLLRRFQ